MGNYPWAHADEPEVTAAHERASHHGHGCVRVSKRRYVVVVHDGVGGSRTGDEPWSSSMSYLTLTRPLPLREAQAVVKQLDDALRKGMEPFKILRDRLSDEVRVKPR